MADLGSHDFANDIAYHGYALVVALTLIVCEYFATLEDELQYIWLSPWSKTKCTYLFARYFALVYVTASIGFSLVWPPPLPVPQSKCMGWCLHGMSCFAAQYIASHITLSRRIMAKYEVRNVGSALLVFHVAELAGGLVSGKGTLSAIKFNGVCDVLNVPRAVFAFVGMFLLGQLLMWALILRSSLRRGSAASSRPAFREMVGQMWYDGEAKIAWVLCSLVFMVNTYRAATGRIVKPAFLFAWPICLLSIGTCRYILSMERYINTHTRNFQDGSHVIGHELQKCDDNTGTHNLPLGCGCPSPCEAPPASVLSPMSNQPYVDPVSHPDSFEFPSSESLRRTHSSCSQSAFDSNIQIDNGSSRFNSASGGLAHRTSTTSMNSSLSTLRHPSIPSSVSLSTEITVPSSSLDIEIGSLHSSSSVNSEELRGFWNEVWSGDERAFSDV